MSAQADISFHSMGSDVRLIVNSPLSRSFAPPAAAVQRERSYVEDFARRLSRFRPDSELSALNGDPAHEVPASLLLRTAVSAGIWAADRTGGLVDPTLVSELERAGYECSMDGCTPAPLSEALRHVPQPTPARPCAESRWRTIEVDNEAGTILRPPGVRIDTGGTGKGLAADAVAHRLRAYTRYLIDCGGDIAVGGVGGYFEPFEIEVEHPLSRESIATLRISNGGVATSGLNVRIWQRADGTYAHHLLDPSSGEPVWSGLIGATALAPTALEAETLSKLALLAGPEGARRALAAHGGIIVHNDGTAELVGPVDAHGAAASSPERSAA